MEDLTKEDLELIEQASITIKRNYDSLKYNHTVGAAVRCKDGKIYTGVNVYSLHGACAEMIAMGTAITEGERDFECIVAVRGANDGEVLPPCGNCRQFLLEYMRDCKVIVNVNDEVKKITVRDLLPFAYLSSEDEE